MRSALILFAVFNFLFGSSVTADNLKSVFDFKANLINGSEKQLVDYKGKVLLIVNTASKCGFTPQYASLQSLYEKYQNQGFEILAFPANDFGSQEPGSNEEIKEFCDLRFKAKFPLFEKITVKGKGIHPLYQYLTQESTKKGSIKWNFSKFLVDQDGQVVNRFSPTTDPLSEKVTQGIESLLSAT